MVRKLILYNIFRAFFVYYLTSVNRHGQCWKAVSLWIISQTTNRKLNWFRTFNFEYFLFQITFNWLNWDDIQYHTSRRSLLNKKNCLWFFVLQFPFYLKVMCKIFVVKKIKTKSFPIQEKKNKYYSLIAGAGYCFDRVRLLPPNI